jgi:hypothetical protein
VGAVGKLPELPILPKIAGIDENVFSLCHYASMIDFCFRQFRAMTMITAIG